MSDSPQLDNGFTRIASGKEGNDVLGAPARCRLSGIEFQIVLWVIRQTWGYQKKEDWISLTQFEHVTGASRSYVCRAIEHLVTYRILVTRKSPGRTVYSLNKRFSEWIVTQGSLVTEKSLELVTPTSQGSDVQDNQLVTPTSHTKEILTKDILQKKAPGQKDLSLDELERRFKAAVIEHQWGDKHYADKMWDQAMQLRPDDRKEFLRKVRVVLNSAGHPTTERFAKKVYHEIAGFVNDRGAMQSRLSRQELEARRLFREEMGQELDVA